MTWTWSWVIETGLKILLLETFGQLQENLLINVVCRSCFLISAAQTVPRTDRYWAPEHLTWAVPLMSSLLILSILISPKENLNVIVSSATPSSFSDLHHLNQSCPIVVLKIFHHICLYGPPCSARLWFPGAGMFSRSEWEDAWVSESAGSSANWW